MKKTLLIILLLPVFAKAQSVVYPGGCCLGNTTFTFSNADSLTHYLPTLGFGDTVVIDTSADTSATILWQIGNTFKPVFSNDTIAARGIMTDTVHTYPPHANNFFVLKINNLRNCIVDFWHRYETDSLHAGGVVEFSTDAGLTWLNAANCPDLNTQNLYPTTDTIVSGQAAFTGTSSGQQLSRVQFLNCHAFRGTSTGCFPNPAYDPSGGVWLRFRFVSDSTVDSLSGWIIDSIEVEYPGCGVGVDNIDFTDRIDVFPNPATSTLTIASTYQPINQVTIVNLLGQTMYNSQYNSLQVQIDVSPLPSGLYFVKVNGSEVRKFMKE